MGIDIEATNRVNLEMLNRARANLERGYDCESFHVFSKCIKNEYYLNEIEKYEGVVGFNTRETSREYPMLSISYFKRETEMIKEVEKLLNSSEEDKEKILEHLEELFKDIKVMYPNLYDTALRKVKMLDK